MIPDADERFTKILPPPQPNSSSCLARAVVLGDSTTLGSRRLRAQHARVNLLALCTLLRRRGTPRL